MYKSGGSGAFYGLGFIGALVYFLQHAANFQEAIFGIIKAIIWPAILIYNVFGLLKL